jgi:hypothetical protein
LKIFKKNSFSKKHIVLSETYKCGEAIHLTILLNISLTKGSNLAISEDTSKISNSSDKNNVYLVKFANGQYFNRPSISG